MDEELHKAIVRYAQTNPEVAILSDEEAEKFRVLIAKRFGFQEELIWWWKSLPKGAVSRPYVPSEALTRLSAILPQDGVVRLFVTDDERPPWVCVSGIAAAIVRLLQEQRFFEYFVTDSEMRWIVFDTHDNVLITLGEGLCAATL